MTRINIYDRGEYSSGELIGWFTLESCTETVDEGKNWNGESRSGTMSGLQVGYEELLRTAGGRWVRHYDGRNEYNGPEYYEFVTDGEARTWLLKNNTEESDAVLKQHFGEPEEEIGPSKGGRPAVGSAISTAYSADLLARIDAAADAAGVTRAAWLRQAAETALA